MTIITTRSQELAAEYALEYAAEQAQVAHGVAYTEATGAYLGYGDTEVERAADAAFQELLDEVDPLDLGLLESVVNSPEPNDAQHHESEVVASRTAIVSLMLHHGWLPPEGHPGSAVKSVWDNGEDVLGREVYPGDWADVMRWQLAKRLRNSTTGDHGDNSEPHPFWLGLADLAAAGVAVIGDV